MKRILPSSLIALLSASLLASCETTTDYGYYVGRLDVETIETLFAISDEAIRQQNFNTYSGLLAPGFTTVDKTDGINQYISRADYLTLVEELFTTAEYIDVATMIMEIQFIEPGRALVTIQEEERRSQFGNAQHFTSMSEVQVGFEDGWAYFERSTRLAQQVIDQ